MYDDNTPATEEAIQADMDAIFAGTDPEAADLPAWMANDAEIANRHDEGECSFCRREGIAPPSIGGSAAGSYRPDSEGASRPVPFRGYVCDMHRDDVDWVSFRWR